MPAPQNQNQIKTWRDIKYCEYPSPDLNDATYEAYAWMFPDVIDPSLWDHTYYKVVYSILKDEP